MIKRGQLRLVSSGKVKRKFKKCIVFLCNESVIEFNLEEWNVYKDYDWIEFDKKDGTELKCFYVSNILSVNFEYTENHVKPDITPRGDIKPVA